MRTENRHPVHTVVYWVLAITVLVLCFALYLQKEQRTLLLVELAAQQKVMIETLTRHNSVMRGAIDQIESARAQLLDQQRALDQCRKENKL